jgi:hypothetical protein
MFSPRSFSDYGPCRGRRSRYARQPQHITTFSSIRRRATSTGRTGSLKRTRFAEKLGTCDEVSFWLITDNSSSGAQYGDSLVFPLVDRNAPMTEVMDADKKIRELRSEAERRIVQMMHEQGAKRSDVVGIFFKLTRTAGRKSGPSQLTVQ